VTNEGLFERIEEASVLLLELTGADPEVGIITGAHLENLIDTIEVTAAIPFDEVPHFPDCWDAVEGGNLLFGHQGGRRVVALRKQLKAGRDHSMDDLVFPVRLMKGMGAELMVACDLARNLDPALPSGAVVMIDDHINLQWDNPLLGRNDERIGPRFPDMSAPYSNRLKELAFSLADEERIPLQIGVYAAVPDLSLVTEAELGFIRSVGADVAGEGIVQEVIAAVHQGMEVMALSVVIDDRTSEIDGAVADLRSLLSKIIEAL
jgi:purine-nucleoside phosphorylase